MDTIQPQAFRSNMNDIHPEDIHWRPIQPLTPMQRDIEVSELVSVSAAWAELQRSMETQPGDAPDEFYSRLRREWAIETGVLEGLYTLDRGTTKTLIDKGFERDLIEHSATDIEPGRLHRILWDHLEASDAVESYIRDSRPISRLFITELHNIITRHQEGVTARNTLGQTVTATLLRGQWKTEPNTIPGPGGATIETCPPEQVDSQIDDLLQYLDFEEQESTNVGIVAAWFHHQFSAIHPFQDGNGRVVRALTNYLFLKHSLFPAVVTRDDRDEYLNCLSSADQGKLTPLVHFFAIKQVAAIKRVLSIHRSLPAPDQNNIVHDLARGIVLRAKDIKEQEQQRLRQVNGVLQHLADSGRDHLQQELRTFGDVMNEGGFHLELPRVTSGGSYDFTGHFYRDQVIDMARQAEQWVNFNEDAWWVRALAFEKISRLRFLLSFHHVGHQLTGVAEVTALGQWTYTGEDEPDDDSGRRQGPDSQQIRCMSQGPFTVTWNDNPELLATRFHGWITECLAVALREWADTF